MKGTVYKLIKTSEGSGKLNEILALGDTMCHREALEAHQAEGGVLQLVRQPHHVAILRSAPQSTLALRFPCPLADSPAPPQFPPPSKQGSDSSQHGVNAYWAQEQYHQGLRQLLRWPSLHWPNGFQTQLFTLTGHIATSREWRFLCLESKIHLGIPINGRDEWGGMVWEWLAQSPHTSGT